LRIFRKICLEDYSFIKYGMKNRYFTWRPIYISDHISLNFFLRRTNVSDKSCRQKCTFYVQ